MSNFSLPLGFRHTPSDDEVIQLLVRKITKNPVLGSDAIFDTDVFGDTPPWELFQLYNNVPFTSNLNEDDQIRYFFTRLYKKSFKNDSSNFKRTIGNIGTWRGGTQPVKIIDPINGFIVGEKRAFSFQPRPTNKDKDGCKWLMTEFSLAGTTLRHSIPDVHYVICQIRKKKQQNQNQQPTSSSTQQDIESAVQPPFIFGHQFLTDEQCSFHPDTLKEFSQQEAAEIREVTVLKAVAERWGTSGHSDEAISGFHPDLLKEFSQEEAAEIREVVSDAMHKRARDENEGEQKTRRENPKMGKVTVSKAVAEQLGTSGHSDEVISGFHPGLLEEFSQDEAAEIWKVVSDVMHKRACDENEGEQKTRRDNPKMGNVTVLKAAAILKVVIEGLGTSGHSDEAISGFHPELLKEFSQEAAEIREVDSDAMHKWVRVENEREQKENARMGKVRVSKAVAERLGTSGHSDEAIGGGVEVGKGMVDTIRDTIGSWMGKGAESHTSQDGNEGAAGGEAAHQHGRYGTVGSWMGKGPESHTWHDGNGGAGGREAVYMILEEQHVRTCKT